MQVLLPGMFVALRWTETSEERCGFLVSHDDYAPNSTGSVNFFDANGRCRPLDELMLNGRCLTSLVGPDDIRRRSFLANLLDSHHPSFVYRGVAAFNAHYLKGHRHCLAMWFNGIQTKILRLDPGVTSKELNAAHACATLERIEAIGAVGVHSRWPFDYGAIVEHDGYGLGVHWQGRVLLGEPVRIDGAWVDEVPLPKDPKNGGWRKSAAATMRYLRPIGLSTAVESDAWRLSPDWFHGATACPKCGAMKLRHEQVAEIGVFRHCGECTWTRLLPTVSSEYRRLVVAEQKYRLERIAG